MKTIIAQSMISHDQAGDVAPDIKKFDFIKVSDTFQVVVELYLRYHHMKI